MTPLDTEIYGIMFTIANDNVYFLVKDIHGRRMYKLCSLMSDVFHKMGYNTHGSLFYEDRVKVYKLPESLCESFNYIRRYWKFFSVCGDHYFGREEWKGENFRTERKYKKQRGRHLIRCRPPYLLLYFLIFRNASTYSGKPGAYRSYAPERMSSAYSCEFVIL